MKTEKRAYAVVDSFGVFYVEEAQLRAAGFAPGDQVEIRPRADADEEYDKWHALTGVLSCPTCHWRLLTPYVKPSEIRPRVAPGEKPHRLDAEDIECLRKGVRAGPCRCDDGACYRCPAWLVVERLAAVQEKESAAERGDAAVAILKQREATEKRLAAAPEGPREDGLCPHDRIQNLCGACGQAAWEKQNARAPEGQEAPRAEWSKRNQPCPKCGGDGGLAPGGRCGACDFERQPAAPEVPSALPRVVMEICGNSHHPAERHDCKNPWPARPALPEEVVCDASELSKQMPHAPDWHLAKTCINPRPAHPPARGAALQNEGPAGGTGHPLIDQGRDARKSTGSEPDADGAVGLPSLVNREEQSGDQQGSRPAGPSASAHPLAARTDVTCDLTGYAHRRNAHEVDCINPVPPFPRCSLCGSSRIVEDDGSMGTCTLIGCKDPMLDYRREHPAPVPAARTEQEKQMGKEGVGLSPELRTLIAVLGKIHCQECGLSVDGTSCHPDKASEADEEGCEVCATWRSVWILNFGLSKRSGWAATEPVSAALVDPNSAQQGAAPAQTPREEVCAPCASGNHLDCHTGVWAKADGSSPVVCSCKSHQTAPAPTPEYVSGWLARGEADARLASSATADPESRLIHPDIPFGKFGEAAKVSAHATAQAIASEIRALAPPSAPPVQQIECGYFGCPLPVKHNGQCYPNRPVTPSVNEDRMLLLKALFEGKTVRIRRLVSDGDHGIRIGQTFYPFNAIDCPMTDDLRAALIKATEAKQ